jgi:sigma-B regulation protein RsbU (phosphoserine phosphatase)
LGVQEGTLIEERSIVLAPGDYLVTYTDGVTDTFSPDGELFGLDGLLQSAREAAFSEGAGSAQGMLQALDARIEAFTHQAPAIDDSTMLVLYRRS